MAGSATTSITTHTETRERSALSWLQPAPRLLRRRLPVMGTEVVLTLVCSSRQRAAEMSASSALWDQLIAQGRDWWAWGPGLLAALNRELAGGAPARIPLPMRSLFTRAWELREASGGLFDPRMAQLVRLWGFDDATRLRSQPPADGELQPLLAALRAAPPYDGGSHYGPAPGIGWDFGGIAKGHFVDAALDLLALHGFNNATLDAGGNVAVRGSAPGRPWRIGIRNPRAAEGGPPLLATLAACDEAVNTHADDQRFFDWQGRRYGHILDPRSGSPASSLSSVTVMHADGTLAEAGGAALFVAGTQHWQALAQQLQLDQVMVVTDQGEVAATATLARRLQAEPGIDIRTV